jgi:hypothetical protein
MDTVDIEGFMLTGRLTLKGRNSARFFSGLRKKNSDGPNWVVRRCQLLLEFGFGVGKESGSFMLIMLGTCLIRS